MQEVHREKGQACVYTACLDTHSLKSYRQVQSVRCLSSNINPEIDKQVCFMSDGGPLVSGPHKADAMTSHSSRFLLQSLKGPGNG